MGRGGLRREPGSRLFGVLLENIPFRALLDRSNGNVPCGSWTSRSYTQLGQTTNCFPLSSKNLKLLRLRPGQSTRSITPCRLPAPLHSPTTHPCHARLHFWSCTRTRAGGRAELCTGSSPLQEASCLLAPLPRSTKVVLGAFAPFNLPPLASAIAPFNEYSRTATAKHLPSTSRSCWF